AGNYGSTPFAFRPSPFALLATGITKRIAVKRVEKAAILLSTRPQERPAFWTSDHPNGNASSAMYGFFGKTAQSEPAGVKRFSRPRKRAESEPAAGTSSMSQACFPVGQAATQSTRGPKVWRTVRRNSGE